MAVTGAAMGPPGGDFGALFGAGVGQPSMQNGWNWKPPGMQLDPPVPAKKPSNVWSWGAKAPELPAEHEELLELPRTGEQLVEASRIAFDDLLRGCEKIERLCEEDVTGLCDFLTSTADEPAARNITRFVQWLETQSVSTMAWESITALICDKIQLASLDDDELIHVIKALPQAFDWQHHESARQQLHDIYAAFSESLLVRNTGKSAPIQAIFEGFCTITQSAQACSDLVDRLNMINEITNDVNASSKNISSTLIAISRHSGKGELQTEFLSRLATTLDRVPKTILTEVIELSTRFVVDMSKPERSFVRAHALNWLQCLSANESLRQSSRRMNPVYAELAKHLRLSQMAKHFASPGMSPLDLMRVLLKTWLPNADLEDLQSRHCGRSNASSRRKEIKTLQFGLRDLSATELPAVAEELERLIAAGDNPSWTLFLRAFARTCVSYGAIAHEVLDLCKAMYSLTATANIFCRMVNNHELVLPSSAAVSLIKHSLAVDRPLLALYLFKQVPSVAIEDVPALPLAVLNHSASTRDVFEILLRRPNAIPMEWRETLKLDVTPKHIEIVHLLAYDIANAAVLDPSQAYRSVWACYRWLQDRGAPLNPLISRAIVTAGILRPLQEHIWIADQRLDYILSIVEKVEGAEDRDQVEMLAIRMRNAYHEGVLSKRRAKIQNSWMKGTRMRANEVRYRLKKWTRKKPLPTEDGRSYFVPHQNTNTARMSSSRNEGAVPSSSVDSSPRSPCTDVVTMSEEAKELEIWWRPDGEEESPSRLDELSLLLGDSQKK